MLNFKMLLRIEVSGKSKAYTSTESILKENTNLLLKYSTGIILIQMRIYRGTYFIIHGIFIPCSEVFSNFILK